MDLAIAAHREGVKFAIGAERLAPLWALLADISESDWTEATWHARRPGRRHALLPGLPVEWERQPMERSARAVDATHS